MQVLVVALLLNAALSKVVKPRWLELRGGSSMAGPPSSGGEYIPKQPTVEKDPIEEPLQYDAVAQRAEWDDRRKKKALIVTETNGVNDGEIGLSEEKMEELALFEGDVVRVTGHRGRWTLCTAVTLGHLESENDCVMNQASLKNCRGRIGDQVKIKASEDTKYALRIHALPFIDTLPLGRETSAEVLIQALENRFTQIMPIAAGDRIEVLVEDALVEFHIADVDSVEMDSDPQGGLVRPEECEWIVDPEYYLDRKDDERLDEIGYDDLGGVTKAIATVRELVETPLRNPDIFGAVGIAPPRGVLLYGPPGSGKTSIARALAEETGAYFFVINGAEILSKTPGEAEANLRKAFEQARKHAPAIIFIDELDALAPRRDAKAQASGGEEQRAARALCDLLDELADDMSSTSAVVVLAATNRPNGIDASLRRFGRLDREVDVGVPDALARLDILRVKTRKARLNIDVDLETIAKNTHGFVGADLAQLCLEAAVDAVREFYLKDNQAKLQLYAGYTPHSEDSTYTICQHHFLSALDRVNPSALRETAASLPKASWADVGGLEDVKRELYETVQFPVEHGDKYRKFGLPPSRGVLFYGPPGCGKTLLAQAVAKECGANFVSIKGPELLTMWFGESEANVRDLFAKARTSAPCILFFDEIDAIAKQRGGGSGGASEAGDRVINQILTEIDGVGVRKDVFVIGATNRPDVLDAAITRPGRLDTLVYIPLPDQASRASIFKATLRKSPVAPDVDIHVLAKHTPGFSGADVAEVCKRAARYAIRDAVDYALENSQISEAPPKIIQRKHFELAMANARRSVTDAELAKFDAYAAKAQRKKTTSSTKNDDNAPLASFKFTDPPKPTDSVALPSE
uniref:Cell division cycle protein 48 n=1 Tax=Aureoumbra lagunensis TaxID=44058 RepID=A0A7S3JVY9_9STRA|mmetsp:Transcript_14469/g.17918  ORF Transcript_14469/g.17918 Transcript_14469/m.17918 type:complete len:862 (-) Transcript_14469:150-2735(-)